MNGVTQDPAPRVGIIMGSQSDWPTMQRATEGEDVIRILFNQAASVRQGQAATCALK